MSLQIPKSEWQWFGKPGHFICAYDCRFHMCTKVGDYLVSTVGEYLPDESIREIKAQQRGFVLEGRGDMRRADYMEKVGYEEIGYARKYETMVFKTDGTSCDSEDCNCGVPGIIPTELEMGAYNDAGAATTGHLAICEKVAATHDQFEEHE
jgi:hypothetical protein